MDYSWWGILPFQILLGRIPKKEFHLIHTKWFPLKLKGKRIFLYPLWKLLDWSNRNAQWIVKVERSGTLARMRERLNQFNAQSFYLTRDEFNWIGWLANRNPIEERVKGKWIVRQAQYKTKWRDSIWVYPNEESLMRSKLHSNWIIIGPIWRSQMKDLYETIWM